MLRNRRKMKEAWIKGYQDGIEDRIRLDIIDWRDNLLTKTYNPKCEFCQGSGRRAVSDLKLIEWARCYHCGGTGNKYL